MDASKVKEETRTIKILVRPCYPAAVSSIFEVMEPFIGSEEKARILRACLVLLGKEGT